MRHSFRSDRSKRKAMSRRNRNTRLRLESLEERRLLATLTVTTTADSGAGSLREAIVVANASTGVPDDIVFNIPTADAGFNLEGNAPAINGGRSRYKAICRRLPIPALNTWFDADDQCG